MTPDETHEIHEKLEEIVEAVGAVKGAIGTQTAVCRLNVDKLNHVCGVVMGNGRDGLVREVERLSTVRSTVKFAITSVVAIVGALTALAGVAWAVWERYW